MTRHRAIDRLRRRKVRLDGNSLSWAEISPEAEPQASGTPEQAAETAIRRERVRAALAQLPPEQQEVLALAYFKGQTHREIAEMLGQPLGTVKTRIRLGMQKLRELLQGESV
jgi:RNA polymerase sigma-70 factor (ECF subfamily)